MLRRTFNCALVNLVALRAFAQEGRQERPGFPPRAVASVRLASKDIPLFKGTLAEFAQAEKLEFLEGRFEKQGEVVEQFYLKQRGEPVFYADNFREPLTFRVTAYSNEEESQWEPRWQRLLSALKVALGTRAVVP
jgi:hypothetical protein